MKTIMFGFEKKSTRQKVPHDIDVAVKADDGLVVARAIGPWRDVERDASVVTSNIVRERGKALLPNVVDAQSPRAHAYGKNDVIEKGMAGELGFECLPQCR